MPNERESYAQRDEFLDEESLGAPDEQALHDAHLLDSRGLDHAAPCLKYEGSLRDGVAAQIKAVYPDLTDEEVDLHLSLFGG